MSGFVLVYTTVSSREQAEKLSQEMIKKRLAACANISGISSFYRWGGRIQEAKEYSVLFKSTKDKERELEAGIKKSHPYKVPCIIKWPVKAGKEYGEWMIESTRK